MKEIMAIIRLNKIQQTKDVLAAAGFPSLSATKVLGRGKQKGLFRETSHLSLDTEGSERVMEFIPKRLIDLVVDDQDTEQVVNLIMAINRSGQVGDGRIFVCPVENAVRIRTGEQGIAALK